MHDLPHLIGLDHEPLDDDGHGCCGCVCVFILVRLISLRPFFWL